MLTWGAFRILQMKKKLAHEGTKEASLAGISNQYFTKLFTSNKNSCCR
jgi:hypothetical protein